MNKLRPYFFILALFFAAFASFFSKKTVAQGTSLTQLGISFPDGVNGQEIQSQIPLFQELGISMLEFQHPVPVSLLDSLEKTSLGIMIRTENKFLTTANLLDSSADLILQFKDVLNYYAPYSNVSAIGLFSFRQPDNELFDAELKLIINSLADSSRISFYEISSINQTSGISAVIQIHDKFYPENGDNYVLRKPFQSSDFEMVSKLVLSDTPLLLFDSVWFEEATSPQSPLPETLREYRETGVFLLPLPNPETSGIQLNWPILVFLITWLIVGIHLKTVPTYRDTMLRYFTFHRFFVDDIMRFRERSALSGTFLLLQHALFTGLLAYILAKHFVGKQGLEALYHHLPLLAVFGKNYFSLFSITVVLTFLIEIIGLLWLYLPSKSMQHFSQTVNLYAWIFHIDFILISLMLILLLTNSQGILLPILGILFILNWLIGFGFCAYDSSKYLLKNRTSYLLYTIGLHTIVNVGLIIFFLTNYYVLDILALITSL